MRKSDEIEKTYERNSDAQGLMCLQRKMKYAHQATRWIRFNRRKGCFPNL